MIEEYLLLDSSTKPVSNNFVSNLNHGLLCLTQPIRSFENKIIILQYNSDLLSCQLSQFLQIEGKTTYIILPLPLYFLHLISYSQSRGRVGGGERLCKSNLFSLTKVKDPCETCKIHTLPQYPFNKTFRNPWHGCGAYAKSHTVLSFISIGFLHLG